MPSSPKQSNRQLMLLTPVTTERMLPVIVLQVVVPSYILPIEETMEITTTIHKNKHSTPCSHNQSILTQPFYRQ
jgi:hypothetical protein